MVKQIKNKTETDVAETIKDDVRVIYKLSQNHKFLIAGLVIAILIIGVVALNYSTMFNNSQGSLSNLQNNYNQLYAKNTGLQASLNSANQTIYSLNSRLASSNATIYNIKSSLSAANNSITNLQLQINYLQQQVSSSNGQTSTLQSQLNSAQATITTQQSTISVQQKQLANLTSHAQLQNTQIIVPKTSGNIALQPSTQNGHSVSYAFKPSYSGILVINVTINSNFQITVTSPSMSSSTSIAGQYFSGSYSGGTNIIAVIPVIGTPLQQYSYTVTISNTDAFNSGSGSVGISLNN